MLRNAELCSPNSCINSAEADEPVFVLRAHDPVASDTVRGWASAYMRSKGGWERMDERQRAKYQEAMRLAEQMDQYARARGWRP